MMIAGSSAAVSRGGSGGDAAATLVASPACRRCRPPPTTIVPQVRQAVADLGDLGPVRLVRDDEPRARIGQPVFEGIRPEQDEQRNRDQARAVCRRHGRRRSRAPAAGGSRRDRRLQALRDDTLDSLFGSRRTSQKVQRRTCPCLALLDERRRARPAIGVAAEGRRPMLNRSGIAPAEFGAELVVGPGGQSTRWPTIGRAPGPPDRQPGMTGSTMCDGWAAVVEHGLARGTDGGIAPRGRPPYWGCGRSAGSCSTRSRRGSGGRAGTVAGDHQVDLVLLGLPGLSDAARAGRARWRRRAGHPPAAADDPVAEIDREAAGSDVDELGRPVGVGRVRGRPEHDAERVRSP